MRPPEGAVERSARRRVPDTEAWVRPLCALVVAGVAAYASYMHQREFALQGGADPVSASLWPLNVDTVCCFWPPLASSGILLRKTAARDGPCGRRSCWGSRSRWGALPRPQGRWAPRPLRRFLAGASAAGGAGHLLGLGRQCGQRGRLRPSRKCPRPRQVLLFPSADGLPDRGGHPPCAGPARSPWWAACHAPAPTANSSWPTGISAACCCGGPSPTAGPNCCGGCPPTGSWLSRIHATSDRAHRDPVTVRVMAYQLHGTGRGTGRTRLSAGTARSTSTARR